MKKTMQVSVSRGEAKEAGKKMIKNKYVCAKFTL
jgi:hypothetical protein